MLPSRRHSLFWIVLFAITCLPAAAQTVCSTTAIAASSAIVTDIQHRLASTKIEDMEAEVSPSLQQDTTLLKNSLATAVQAIVACQLTDAQPSAIQSALAQTLHGNVQQPPNALVPWGGNLHVTVDQTTAPQVLRVQVTYAIECGDDTMVLLFAPGHGQWSEKLLWQSPPYKETSGAFGDFFLTTILPGKTPDDLRLVVAHGKPWCTSRFSGFGIDVLAPNPTDPHPQVLWHTDRAYSRSDFTPTLKASGDVFELRLHEDEMSFDIETAFERTVIYRYRVVGNNVARLEPIATTGRGFVEEWLSMPWLEAKNQTLPTNADKVQPIHQLYESSYAKSSKSFISWTSGPVQSCTTPGHFQVTFTAQLNKTVPGQSGDEKDEPVAYYFQIKQAASGYEMESASETLDPSCIGRDLMAQPTIKAR